MKPSPRISLLALRDCLSRPSASSLCRIHTNPSAQADVVPVYGTGPPPEPPAPAEPASDPRVARRKRQAEMIKQAKDLRAAANKSSSSNKPGSSPLKKRFWDHVHVVESDSHLEISLDARPLRHPTTKEPIRIPSSKPHLAAAVALEWDLLTSAQQATKQHLIPLTSLACRALDIGADDAAASSSDGLGQIRRNVTDVLLRYLDTDSLLCLAPPPDPHNPILQSSTLNDSGESLREVQERAAVETIAWLTSHVWPGVEIEPVLDGESIMPKSQKPGVREVVQGWVTGLDHWELAGLERGVLASKSLLTGARLVAEWSEGDAGVGRNVGGDEKFGVEEAARAASIEVDWQIGRWGEVEDTHDVEKEDLRRQLGSVILLVSGTGGQ
jgi:ATP synthase F1 complex assembly factor 2